MDRPTQGRERAREHTARRNRVASRVDGRKQADSLEAALEYDAKHYPSLNGVAVCKLNDYLWSDKTDLKALAAIFKVDFHRNGDASLQGTESIPAPSRPGP